MKNLLCKLSVCVMAIAAGCAPVGADEALIGTSVDSIDIAALRDGTWGGNNEGGGVAMAQIDSDPRRDLVFFRVDAPSGENRGYYRVGYNVALQSDGTYAPTSFSPFYAVPGWIGAHTSGADVAIGDINNDGAPDMVQLWVDDPSGTDATYYRIGWGLRADGSVTSWSGVRNFTGGFHGDHTTGAGVELRDLNGNGTLDMLVATMDNPNGDNRAYMSFGWDLSSNGIPVSYSSHWGNTLWTGDSTKDMSVRTGDFNNNGRTDVVIAWVDNPSDADQLYYQVGYDLESVGPTGWGPVRRLGPVLGFDTNGAGIVVDDFNGNGSLDLLGFTIDGAQPSNRGMLMMAMDREDAVYQVNFAHAGGCIFDNLSTTYVTPTTCNSSARGQQFTFARNDNGNYHVINARTGRWVGMSTTQSASYAGHAEYAHPESSMNNQFVIRGNGNGRFSLQLASGLCIMSLFPSSSMMTQDACRDSSSGFDASEIVNFVRLY